MTSSNAEDKHDRNRLYEVVDRNVIESLIALGGDDDPHLLEELIDLFLTDGDVRVAEIEEAVETRDLTRIATATHTLKSASANLGVLHFSEFCREIETRARLGESTAAFDLAREIGERFAVVRQALETLRDQRGMSAA